MDQTELQKRVARMLDACQDLAQYLKVREVVQFQEVAACDAEHWVPPAEHYFPYAIVGLPDEVRILISVEKPEIYLARRDSTAPRDKFTEALVNQELGATMWGEGEELPKVGDRILDKGVTVEVLAVEGRRVWVRFIKDLH